MHQLVTRTKINVVHDVAEVVIMTAEVVDADDAAVVKNECVQSSIRKLSVFVE
jgi:hypothetical protein